MWQGHVHFLTSAVSSSFTNYHTCHATNMHVNIHAAHSLYVFQHSNTYVYIIMLQILNVYFFSTFTASSSDFANGSSIVFTYYINLLDLGTIRPEMSMI